MLEIGSVVDGKYKILNKIGQGGMSVVYLAINEAANKPWAIKEVRKDGTKDFEVVRQGLIVETDMLKRLNHPNLPSIVDVIDRDDTFLIVMDYIEGKSLNSVLKENGAQPQEYVIEWAKQLCDVLGYLHSRKPPIIYRDMKPANIMLKPDGNITLIDFGTAREYKNAGKLEDTTCLGTQGYAAPEQFGGHGQTDARTDIFNLGATIYHLVTGHNPAKPPYEMRPIREWNPHLSSGLEQIILKCTQPNPEMRYQSCSELMYALDHFEEMDYEYQRSQKLRFAAFALTLGASLLLFTASGFMHHKETVYAKQNYGTYFDLAKASTSEDEFTENIESALDLNATNSESYNLILEKYIDEFNDEEGKGSILTKAESEKINKIINKQSSDSVETRLEKFRAADEYGYYQFCYNYGLEIWADIDNGSNSAKTWLEKVEPYSDGEINNNKDYETAQLLISLSNYGNSNSGGNKFDNNIDYVQFWKDLKSIFEKASDAETVSTKKTQLYAYKRILSMLSNNDNMNGFYGVIEAKNITKLIDDIEKEVTDKSKFNPNDQAIESAYNEVITQIEIARDKFQTISNNHSGEQNLPSKDSSSDDESGGDPE